MKDSLIKIGEIVAAHGIKGDVKIRSLAESPRDFERYAPLYTPKNEIMVVKIRSVNQNILIASVMGISSRSQAEALKGTSLFIEKSKLPALSENTHYFHQLVGLHVETPEGQQLGTITAMHNFGAGDILEIAIPGKKQTEMWVYNATTVKQVDLANQRLIYQPLEEWIVPASSEREET